MHESLLFVMPSIALVIAVSAQWGFFETMVVLLVGLMAANAVGNLLERFKLGAQTPMAEESGT